MISINVSVLENKISNNRELIEKILTKLCFINLKYHSSKNYYTFPRIDGDNPNGYIFFCESLTFKSTTRNHKGNIFTLIMDLKGMNFPKALEWTAATIGLKKSEIENSSMVLPFGGFFKSIPKALQEPESTMKVYDMDDYSHILNICNTLWIKDEISYKTQEFFHIGYDNESDSILIPEFTFDGELCGIQARNNDKDCPHDRRWWAYLPCSRIYTLYGYHYNYKTICEKGICIVVESEKGVMQLHEFGYNVGLGSCACNLSETQAKYIKSMFLDVNIIAYDEGLDEEIIREQCEKLIVSNKLAETKIGYIYDRENKYIPKGSKASPTDFGKDIFEKLLKECVVWIEREV